MVVAPEGSAKRDQNSLILLDKVVFDAASVREVTSEIVRHDRTKSIAAPGDLLAITATTSGQVCVFLPLRLRITCHELMQGVGCGVQGLGLVLLTPGET